MDTKDSEEETKFCVITVSDSCYNGKNVDESGPHLQFLIRQNLSPVQISYELVPDEQIIIENILREYVKKKFDVILTTGGTGFAERDVTPEATLNVISRECPFISTAMFLESLKMTPMAALSRARAGITEKTLIVNFPGSKKAVIECWEVIKGLLPHAINLLKNNLKTIKDTHMKIQGVNTPNRVDIHHKCSHMEPPVGPDSRVSGFPVVSKDIALNLILQEIEPIIDAYQLPKLKSPVNIPPFNAAIKDGYAMKSTGFSGTKRVVGYVSAGNPPNGHELKDDECFKINTGAPVPKHADCVIPIELTKLLKTKKDGTEDLVDILKNPEPMSDIRPVGCDLRMGEDVFPVVDCSNVVTKSLLSSVGIKYQTKCPKIVIISTGNELMEPVEPGSSKSIEENSVKVYDSNTTMLKELLKYFGFECQHSFTVEDDKTAVSSKIQSAFNEADVVISTGGVSMGDKDYIKPVLSDLGFEIKFGRVKVKPGLPTTFATKGRKLFFGLPGNPVSAFVTFHIFVLPALRKLIGNVRNKLELSTVTVRLENEKLELDPRPEYARATVTSREGVLYAHATGDQISSRLQSIVGADVLIQLPERTNERTAVFKNEVFKAFVLRYDFISNYR